MQISTSREGNVLTVALEGRLDTATTPQVGEALTPALENTESCILDMARVDYISSAGLRLLLQLHKRMQAQGGSFALLHVAPGVRDILDMTGFTSFLTIK